MIRDNVAVLIVEDDLLQSLLLQKLSLSLGYVVVGKAETGQEAIDLATNLKPDLIMMDIMLADDIDGIEAAIEIQKVIDVDLVYLSANKDKNILKRVSETNYREFFRKPFAIELLKDFLGQYVR